MQHAHHRRSAGMAVSPAVFLLALLVIAMMAWRTIARYVAFTNARVPSSVITRAITIDVVTLVVMLAVAGGVGALCYFAFRKSDRAGAIGMGSILALCLCVLLSQAYFTYIAPRPATPAVANSPTPLQPPVSPAAPIPPRAAPPFATAPSSPTATPAPEPVSSPQSSPSPSPIAAAPPKQSDTIKARDEERAKAAQELASKVSAAWDPIHDDLSKSLETLADDLKPALARFAKGPEHSRSALAKRIADADELRTRLVAATKRFDTLRDDLNKALIAQGVDSITCSQKSIELPNKFLIIHREAAAKQLIQLLDEVTGEARLLADNFGKWNADSSGKFTTKDTELRMKQESARFRVNVGIDRSDANLRRLTGVM